MTERPDTGADDMTTDVNRREILKTVSAIGIFGGAIPRFSARGTGGSNSGDLLVFRSGGGPRFGEAVAVDRGIAVVGAPPEHVRDGSDAKTATVGPATGNAVACVFRGGCWTRQATFVPAARTPGGDFGTTVAVDGTSILVGAPLPAFPNGPHSGAVTAFERSDDEWHRQATLTAGSTGVDRFGAAIDVDDDTAVVGAPGDSTHDGERTGSVTVFARPDEDWTTEATLAPGTEGVHQFGRAVAIDGDLAVVGARWTYEHEPIDSGAAFVFRRSSGSWSRAAVLTLGDSRDNGLGQALATDGRRLLAGAPAESTAAGHHTGAAYLFARSAGKWKREARFRRDDATANDQFGSSVAISGGIALVGTRSPDGPSALVRTDGRWVRRRPFVRDGDSVRRSGVDVALDGSRAVVGVPGWPASGGNRHGVLEVFRQ
jgi:hypothetical protein